MWCGEFPHKRYAYAEGQETSGNGCQDVAFETTYQIKNWSLEFEVEALF